MCAAKKFLRTVFIVILLVTGLFICNCLSQETYPNRSITMVLPWAGGMSEVMMRALCKVAEKELGQPIIMEPKTGAGGAIGMNYLSKAKPDGYTLGVATTNVLIIQPHMQEVPHNVFTDFTDILVIYKSNLGLSVRADSPWNTFEDLIAYARKNPGKFKYGTTGVGVSQHICMEQIAMKEKIKWTAIPFKGEGESIAACLGGHTDACTQSALATSDHIKSGKMRLLLSLTDSRWPEYRNVPHILEKGYDFIAVSYLAVHGPGGLPESLRQKLESVFRRAKKDPSILEFAEKFQVTLVDMGGKEYSALWKTKYYDEMGKVIKALGIGLKK